jgi:YbbR domain-containing protein
LYLGVSNIALNDQLNLSFTPAVYYLNVDKKAGTYFTANGSISHKKSPFSLQSTINQTLETKITGGKDFLWNIALVYKIK